MIYIDQRALRIAYFLLAVLAASWSFAVDADKLIPRAQPVATRRIDIQPYETDSTAPWGGHRMGGWDQRTFTFSPEGKMLVTQDSGIWQLELWDVASGKSLGKFGKISDPSIVAFSPDNTTIVTIGGERGVVDLSTVDLWDAQRREKVRSLDEGVCTTPLTAVAFSPDGKTLALGTGLARRPIGGSSLGVHFWSVDRGEELRQFALPGAPNSEPSLRSGPSCLAFSPDGQMLAIVQNRALLLYELATGKERAVVGYLPPSLFQVDRNGDFEILGARGVAFHPNGRLLSVACSDGVVRTWDVISGKELLPLEGHKGAVRAIVFAADGKRLLSFGRDNKLVTWNVDELYKVRKLSQETLSATELASLWDDLSTIEHAKLNAAMRILAAYPNQTLPLLKERLKPAPPVDSKRISQLVADLGGDDFNQRKSAARELRKLGDVVLPALQQRSNDRNGRNFDLEYFVREFAGKLEAEFPTAEQRPLLYGIQIAQRIGNQEARELLEKLAEGAPEAMLTKQAKECVAQVSTTATEAEQEISWEKAGRDLEGEDARLAFASIRAIAKHPDLGLPVVAERLKGLASSERFDDDPERVSKLVADLDDSEFKVRETATKELGQLGAAVEPLLREKLETTLSNEARFRVQTILKTKNKPIVIKQKLIAQRAVEALERTVTPESREVLSRLSKESKNTWLKDAASAALDRMRP